MPTPKPEKKKIKNEKNSNLNSVKKWAWDNMPSPDVITKNNDIINYVKKCARDNRPSTNVIIHKSMKNMDKIISSANSKYFLGYISTYFAFLCCWNAY